MNPAEGQAIQLGGETAGYYGEAQGEEYSADAATADEDAVAMEDVPLDYMGPSHATTGRGRLRSMPKYQTLDYKRTTIPILLSSGICMAVLAGSRFVLREDTKLGSLPTWMVLVLFTGAALALTFGALTMVSVKQAMAAAAAARRQADEA